MLLAISTHSVTVSKDKEDELVAHSVLKSWSHERREPRRGDLESQRGGEKAGKTRAGSAWGKQDHETQDMNVEVSLGHVLGEGSELGSGDGSVECQA